MEYIRKIRNSWPVLALCVFYIYLAFHALSGSQGLVSWVDYENDITKYQAELELLQEERQRLEKRTDALKASQMDLDALDIRARETAFVSHPNEFTIWLDPSPKK